MIIILMLSAFMSVEMKHEVVTSVCTANLQQVR